MEDMQKEPLSDQRILIIACGALAREIQTMVKLYQWQHIKLKCLPAALHNHPHLISDRLRSAILETQLQYDRIFIGYADCGTGGAIDQVLEEFEGIERLSGPHCYATFAGQEPFLALAETEPGTFYLTDFLARHFKKFVIQPLKLDQHPQLRDAYFGNYRRVVYLSQTNDNSLHEAARAAADYLGLKFDHNHTGYGELQSRLIQLNTIT